MASQAYDKALQLDRGNQAAQGKLNLIKDLFSQTPRPAGKVTVAKADTAAAPAAQPAPTPAAPAAKPAPAPQAAAQPSAPAKAVETPAASSAASTAKPAPESKAAAPARGTEDVLKSVNAWARAWASNDVPAYISAYASDFQTPKGMSRSGWEAERKARIAKPRKIEVEVDSPRVNFDEKNRAIVSFRQHYKSGPMNVTSGKTLVMVKNGDKWLIQQERAGS
jgi:ketosteroid isomerase-like protein